MSYASYTLGKYASVTSIPKKRAIKLFEQVNIGIEECRLLRDRYDPSEIVRRKFSPYWQLMDAMRADKYLHQSDLPGWEHRNDDNGDKWLSSIIIQRIEKTKAVEFRLCIDKEFRNQAERESERIKNSIFNEAQERCKAAAQQKYEEDKAHRQRIEKANAQVRVDAYLRRKKKEDNARYISLASK